MLTNPIGELIYYRDAGDFPYQCLWTILAATNQVIMFQHSTQWLDYIGVSIEVREVQYTGVTIEVREVQYTGVTIEVREVQYTGLTIEVREVQNTGVAIEVTKVQYTVVTK